MRSRKAGYSLFEVLIAFAILSLVLTALIPGQARLLGRAIEADQRALAYDYALSIAAEIGTTDVLLFGQTEARYRGWRIVQRIEPTKPMETGQIISIEIEIFAEHGPRIAFFQTAGYQRDEP